MLPNLVTASSQACFSVVSWAMLPFYKQSLSFGSILDSFHIPVSVPVYAIATASN